MALRLVVQIALAVMFGLLALRFWLYSRRVPDERRGKVIVAVSSLSLAFVVWSALVILELVQH